MVSELDSGLRDPSSSPGSGQLRNSLCSWARHFILIVPSFTQAYIWVTRSFNVLGEGEGKGRGDGRGREGRGGEGREGW